MERKPVKVVIGTPCYTGNIDVEVAGRLGMYLHKLAKTHPEITVEWNIVRRSFVHSARNKITHSAIHRANADYIWWVDDDCLIPMPEECGYDILPKLMSHDKEIVVTPYYLRRPPYSPGVLRATDYLDPYTYKNLSLEDMKQGLIEIDGGGTHCMLVKTSLMKEMPMPWFALCEMGGTEDMYMCLKAKKMGYKVWCDSDIEAGHMGYAPVITSDTLRQWNEQGRINV